MISKEKSRKELQSASTFTFAGEIFMKEIIFLSNKVLSKNTPKYADMDNLNAHLFAHKLTRAILLSNYMILQNKMTMKGDTVFPFCKRYIFCIYISVSQTPLPYIILVKYDLVFGIFGPRN